MGSSKRLAAHYDMRAQHRAILAAARVGSLQSLTDRELNLREHPVTIYPHPFIAVRDSGRKPFVSMRSSSDLLLWLRVWSSERRSRCSDAGYGATLLNRWTTRPGSV